MRFRNLSVLILIALIAGCPKSGPELAPVSGRVTLDGQPLENADLVFQPEGSKSPSYGRTDKDGNYQLGYKQGVMGAMLGPHTVTITISSDVAPDAPPIPARYNTQTELRQEVKADQNEFNFDLTTAEE